MQGILTAELYGDKKRTFITGTDEFDLTMRAIRYIMDKAIDSEVWAKGHIILKDRFGTVLKEMLAKV